MKTFDQVGLRELVAHLTRLGSRVVWDGDDRVNSIAMFGSEIVDRDLGMLRQLPGLRQVNLTRSRISDAGLFHLGKLQSLEVLLLGGTAVTDEGFEMLEPLMQLKQLNITATDVTDRSMPIVGRMAALEALWLDGTDITDLALEAVAGLRSLLLLDLRRTAVTDAGMKQLRGLENLEELNLAGCQQITGHGLAELSGLRRMDWLSLDATAIDDEALQHIVGLPLTVLSLNWTGLTNAALCTLEQIGTLNEVRLLGTKIDSSRVDRFRSARPACVIQHSA